MNSQKVKEIKEALECCTNNKGCEPCPRLSKKPYHLDDCRFALLADILTLINELESENERLKKDCAGIANDYQEMGGFYYEEAQKNQQLKDKVTELESENKELRVVVDIANERTYRKKFTDEWRKEYQKELEKQGNGHIAGHPDFDLVYKLYFEQKDRIAELESENERLKILLAQANAGIVNCSGCKLVELNAVKEFAERLKEKYGKSCSEYYPLLLELTSEQLDETLKEYEK